MNIALWSVQIISAAVFLFSGINKSRYSEKELIAKGQTGVVNLPAAFIKFIGITEILGAAGLILPQALQISPWLTQAAAIGCALIMIPAAIIHYRLHEPKNILTNMALFAMCVFVAWGRA